MGDCLVFTPALVGGGGDCLVFTPALVGGWVIAWYSLLHWWGGG